MQKHLVVMGWLALAMLVLIGCGTQPTTEAPTPSPTPEPTQVPPTPTPEPTIVVTPSGPERIEFTSDDGTPLVGLYYRALTDPAPGVLLLHQAGVDKSIWDPLPAILQGGNISPMARSGAQMMPSYAVFSIDYPGYGESGGDYSDEAALVATRSALATFRTLDGVDPDTIFMIGGSFGADATVDECNEGCVGSIAVSPGSWLGIPFIEALNKIASTKDTPVLCITGQGDRTSYATCDMGTASTLSDYQVHIYESDAHGNYLLKLTGLTPAPDPYDLITTWLADHLP